MRKSVFVLAVVGAACSSVAFAAEVKKDKAHIPAVKATTMSDADMDKVTAGAAGNAFYDVNGVYTGKSTGSDNNFNIGRGNANPGALYGGTGTVNANVHVSAKP